MELYDFVKLIRGKKKTIFTIVLTVLILVLGINFVLPKKYSSEMQVIIIQNNLNNTDPYLVSKSSEHLGNILSRVIYSGSFYNKVIGSGFGIDKLYFGGNYRDELKIWKKTIKIDNIEDTGIINIKASHKDRNQSELIVEAIVYNLKTSHKEYHGSGDNVEVKTINEAVTSNFPSEPNFVINIIGGFVFSILFSFIYIYLFPDRKYDLRLLPKRKNNKIKRIESFLSEDESIKEIPTKEEKQRNDESLNENDDLNNVSLEEFGGYDHEDEKDANDDLDIDYEDIKRRGNIDNIL